MPKLKRFPAALGRRPLANHQRVAPQAPRPNPASIGSNPTGAGAEVSYLGAGLRQREGWTAPVASKRPPQTLWGRVRFVNDDGYENPNVRSAVSMKLVCHAAKQEGDTEIRNL